MTSQYSHRELQAAQRLGGTKEPSKQVFRLWLEGTWGFYGPNGKLYQYDNHEDAHTAMLLTNS